MADGTLKVGTITTSSGSGNITIPSGVTLSGGGIANTPAFKADFTSGQSVSSGSATVVTFNNELLDTDSCYNTSTYKFIPNKAGWYFLHALIRFPSTSDFDNCQIIIQKNGDAISFINERALHYESRFTSVIVEANGSSDYFQVVAYQDSGSSISLSANSNDGRNFFAGYKLIGV